MYVNSQSRQASQYPRRRYGLGQTYSTAQIQQMITASAQQYGVSPQLALGIASHESAFNPNAVNSANANGTKDWGVMQLNDTTVQTFGVSDPLDPQQNIDAGMKLLAQLSAKYNGDPTDILWAYMSGSGNVNPSGNPPTAVQNFINYVTTYGGGTSAAIPTASGDAGTTDLSSALPSFDLSSIDFTDPTTIAVTLGIGLAIAWALNA